MPLYTFQDKNTGEIVEEYIKIKELPQFLESHPHLAQLLTAPQIISGVMWKPPSGFNDILKKISKDYPRSNVHTF